MWETKMSPNLEAINDVAQDAPSRPRAVPQHSSSGAAGPPDQSPAEAEVARLVHGLFLCAPAKEQPRIVAFSGVDRGAGCSWVCAKAAELLATHTSGLVCVVDANLLHPSLHEYFRAEVTPGLADALKQAGRIERFVVRTATKRLWMMPAGSRQDVSIGILDPSQMRGRLAELREEFDFVLVDAAAISVSRQPVVVGGLSDGVVMVIASNCTRRDAARIAKQTLEDAKVPTLGGVLNRRTYPIPAAVYRRI
jgi:Mrp family chromosome partitioning ATPase